jgi:hypothetical protein
MHITCLEIRSPQSERQSAADSGCIDNVARQVCTARSLEFLRTIFRKRELKSRVLRWVALIAAARTPSAMAPARCDHALESGAEAGSTHETTQSSRRWSPRCWSGGYHPFGIPEIRTRWITCDSLSRCALTSVPTHMAAV